MSVRAPRNDAEIIERCLCEHYFDYNQLASDARVLHEQGVLVSILPAQILRLHHHRTHIIPCAAAIAANVASVNGIQDAIDIMHIKVLETRAGARGATLGEIEHYGAMDARRRVLIIALHRRTHPDAPLNATLNIRAWHQQPG